MNLGRLIGHTRRVRLERLAVDVRFADAGTQQGRAHHRLEISRSADVKIGVDAAEFDRAAERRRLIWPREKGGDVVSVQPAALLGWRRCRLRSTGRSARYIEPGG